MMVVARHEEEAPLLGETLRRGGVASDENEHVRLETPR
jgi:hypothetical protein